MEWFNIESNTLPYIDDSPNDEKNFLNQKYVWSVEVQIKCKNDQIVNGRYNYTRKSWKLFMNWEKGFWPLSWSYKSIQ